MSLSNYTCKQSMPPLHAVNSTPMRGTEGQSDEIVFWYQLTWVVLERAQ